MANSGRCALTVDGKLNEGSASDLLALGQMVIARLKNATGQGNPDCGDAFGRAQAAFDAVDTTLKSAVPANGWDGPGACAYADQNTRQQFRCEAMADADREVHKVLCREAAQLTLRRGYLDGQSNFLASMTVSLQSIPRYSEAMKMAIEIAALQTALGESCRQMNQLQAEVRQNAAELHQAVGRYSGVADGAELAGTAEGFGPRPESAGALPALEALVSSQRDPTSDRLQAPVATKLNSDKPPGTPLQDGM